MFVQLPTGHQYTQEDIRTLATVEPAIHALLALYLRHEVSWEQTLLNMVGEMTRQKLSLQDELVRELQSRPSLAPFAPLQTHERRW
jgi:hypothetical protein